MTWLYSTHVTLEPLEPGGNLSPAVPLIWQMSTMEHDNPEDSHEDHQEKVWRNVAMTVRSLHFVKIDGNVQWECRCVFTLELLKWQVWCIPISCHKDASHQGCKCADFEKMYLVLCHEKQEQYVPVCKPHYAPSFRYTHIALPFLPIIWTLPAENSPDSVHKMLRWLRTIMASFVCDGLLLPRVFKWYDAELFIIHGTWCFTNAHEGSASMAMLLSWLRHVDRGYRVASCFNNYRRKFWI